MGKRSAGLLMFRWRDSLLEVLLVHPGGPFWRHKDQGAWSIPKGEYSESEDRLAAAQREFREETGLTAQGTFLPLGEIRQFGGKVVCAWALEGDCDSSAIRSTTFLMEWPPRSGNQREFPEIDRSGWFSIPEAREKILAGQRALLDRLCVRVGYTPPAPLAPISS